MSSETTQKRINDLFGTHSDKKTISVEDLYNQHRKIMKNVQTVSTMYQKLSNTYTYIRNCLKALEESYTCENIPQSNLCLDGVRLCFQGFVLSNNKIKEHFEETATRLNHYNEMYSATMKKKYAKYEEIQQNYEHYYKKLESLKKNNQKQLDQERYVRNIEKFSSAEEQYTKATNSIFQGFKKVNHQIWNNCINYLKNTCIVIGQGYEEAVKHIRKQNLSEYDEEIDFLDEEDEEKPNHQEKIENCIKNLIQKSSKRKQKIRISIKEYFDRKEEESKKKIEGKLEQKCRKNNFMVFENIFSQPKDPYIKVKQVKKNGKQIFDNIQRLDSVGTSGPNLNLLDL